jgi:TRAP-type C4-dicarboxylate transport system permease large subunit
MAGGALGFLIPPNVLIIINAFLVHGFVDKPFAAGLLF